ncbi:hypothetical protein GCM10010298_72850 [Streptomyces microflavus]|uniref:Uncharacterized protein n=1 Tax=Streptomyces microflavus TaxID=1919 RepID=A0A7J0CJA4_STRMI|nr:hypothetical protein Smic_09240 [Streptomyces microflavus]GGX96921.1 hypothetical protein GCM10010298_72850 [Streptomyces microflavus]
MGTEGHPKGEREPNSAGEPELEEPLAPRPWRAFRPNGRGDEGEALTEKRTPHANIIIHL